ncbi:MAG TPA: NAD(P)H-binding protein [Thermoanaerobaculia bacterium]|nr:NAD(P)H-binding protein [Thermoanaerobaculia bacterium]
MRIAITGGTGFIGRHLARELSARGAEVVLVARGRHRHDSEPAVPGSHFVAAAADDLDALAAAFRGCDAVMLCAGINREIGKQTYQRVHIEGTRAAIEAARRAGVRRIEFLSFLRARPNCGSAYHESKWAAEEMVRASGIEYTVVKPGMTYGRGDHMLDHITRAAMTQPLFLGVGLREMPIRPLAIEDLAEILAAALIDGRMSNETVFATGPEEMTLSQAVRRVAAILGRRVVTIPAPLWIHRALSRIFEWTMKVPLAASAQVRILSEGVVDPLPFAVAVPPDLAPRRMFTDEQIRRGMPPAERFGLRDLRCCWAESP